MRRNNQPRSQPRLAPAFRVSCVNHPSQTGIVSGRHNANIAARGHRDTFGCWRDDVLIEAASDDEVV